MASGYNAGGKYPETRGPNDPSWNTPSPKPAKTPKSPITGESRTPQEEGKVIDYSHAYIMERDEFGRPVGESYVLKESPSGTPFYTPLSKSLNNVGYGPGRPLPSEYAMQVKGYGPVREELQGYYSKAPQTWREQASESGAAGINPEIALTQAEQAQAKMGWSREKVKEVYAKYERGEPLSSAEIQMLRNRPTAGGGQITPYGKTLNLPAAGLVSRQVQMSSPSSQQPVQTFPTIEKGSFEGKEINIPIKSEPKIQTMGISEIHKVDVTQGIIGRTLHSIGTEGWARTFAKGATAATSFINLYPESLKVSTSKVAGPLNWFADLIGAKPADTGEIESGIKQLRGEQAVQDLQKLAPNIVKPKVVDLGDAYKNNARFRTVTYDYGKAADELQSGKEQYVKDYERQQANNAALTGAIIGGGIYGLPILAGAGGVPAKAALNTLGIMAVGEVIARPVIDPFANTLASVTDKALGLQQDNWVVGAGASLIQLGGRFAIFSGLQKGEEYLINKLAGNPIPQINFKGERKIAVMEEKTIASEEGVARVKRPMGEVEVKYNLLSENKGIGEATSKISSLGRTESGSLIKRITTDFSEGVGKVTQDIDLGKFEQRTGRYLTPEETPARMITIEGTGKSLQGITDLKPLFEGRKIESINQRVTTLSQEKINTQIGSLIKAPEMKAVFINAEQGTAFNTEVSGYDFDLLGGEVKLSGIVRESPIMRVSRVGKGYTIGAPYPELMKIKSGNTPLMIEGEFNLGERLAIREQVSGLKTKFNRPVNVERVYSADNLNKLFPEFTEEEVAGVYTHGENSIGLARDLPAAEARATFRHELGHSMDQFEISESPQWRSVMKKLSPEFTEKIKYLPKEEKINIFKTLASEDFANSIETYTGGSRLDKLKLRFLEPEKYKFLQNLEIKRGRGLVESLKPTARITQEVNFKALIVKASGDVGGGETRGGRTGIVVNNGFSEQQLKLKVGEANAKMSSLQASQVGSILKQAEGQALRQTMFSGMASGALKPLREQGGVKLRQLVGFINPSASGRSQSLATLQQSKQQQAGGLTQVNEVITEKGMNGGVDYQIGYFQIPKQDNKIITDLLPLQGLQSKSILKQDLGLFNPTPNIPKTPTTPFIPLGGLGGPAGGGIYFNRGRGWSKGLRRNPIASPTRALRNLLGFGKKRVRRGKR